jgi:hypothetical protein
MNELMNERINEYMKRSFIGVINKLLIQFKCTGKVMLKRL